MAEKRIERQSNIELLRIAAIAGVIILHFNLPDMGGALSLVKEGELNYYVLNYLETVCICAVDLFMLISGFFLYEKTSRDLWKPIALIVQVILFAESIYLVGAVLKSGNITASGVIHRMIPSNYFVIFYCTVYIVSPFINALLRALSEKNQRLLMIVLLLLFSVWPTAADLLGEIDGAYIVGLSTVGAFGSQWGYTIVNFLLMYTIGAYIKIKKDEIEKISTSKLIAAWIMCVIVLMIWARFNDRIGCISYITAKSAWEYCNPLVIAEAALAFVLFDRISIGSNSVINSISKCCFTVYLLHETLLSYIPVQSIIAKSTPVALLLIVGTVVAVIGISWIVHLIYSSVMDPVFRMLKKMIRLPIIAVED